MSSQQKQAFRDLILSGQDNRLSINQTINITPSETRSLRFESKSPYLGLSRFEESDSVYFFGRQRLVSELLDDVARAKLTLVTGASGSGKSSLISAGLLPQLRYRARKERFRSLSLTPDRNPFESLRSSLLAQRYRQEQADLARLETQDTLLNLTAALRAPSELWFIFIDQFEEIFTLCTDVRLRTAFIEGLVKLIEAPDQAVCVLLAMRADFFDRLGAHPDLATLVERNLCLVKDMQTDELRAAIAQPAAKHGVVFEEGLVETIINEVRGQPAALPLIQYTLDLLWQQSDFSTQRVLTTQAYGDLGGVLGALERRAESLFKQCTSTQQDLIRKTFLRLVNLADSTSGVRAVSKKAPRRNFGSQEEDRLIATLIEAKLLVASSSNPGDSASESTIEIAHESLLNSWTRLSAWLGQAREVIEVYGRLLADSGRWDERISQRGETEAAEDLWTGSRLEQALAMRGKQDFASVLGSLPTKVERFLDASVLLRSQREQSEEEQRAREQQLLRDREQIRQEELSIFVENGRQSLQAGRSMAALAWLNEAYQRGSMDPCLPRLLALGIEQIGPEPTCLRGHQGSVNNAQFSHDGATIVSGGDDGTARLWDAATGASLAILRGHNGPVLDVQFVCDDTAVLTCSADGTARMWDARSGELLWILEGHDDAILTIAIDRSRRYAVTASADWTARIWDLLTRNMIYTLDGHDHVVSDARFSPDNRFVVTACGSGHVRLWDIQVETPQAMVLHGHEAAVDHACFDAIGDRLVSASEDGTACVWNVRGELLARLVGHQGAVHSASFRGSSSNIVLTASEDGYARLWKSEPTPKLLLMFRGHERAVISACFSTDCTQVLTASYDGSACLWDTESGVRLASLQGHEGPLLSAQFSPDGRRVVTSSRDGTVRVWTPASGAKVDRVGDETEIFLDIATSGCEAPRVLTIYSHGIADGEVVTVRDLDSGLRLSHLKWVPPDGGDIADFFTHILSASFSGDGMRLITVSDEGTLIWDAAHGLLLSTLASGSEKMRCCSFRADGRFVATGDESGIITLWDADSAVMVQKHLAHEGAIRFLTFSNRGTRIISEGADGAIRLGEMQNARDARWVTPPRKIAATATGKMTLSMRLAALESRASKHVAPKLSPDDTQILSIDNDDFIGRIWDAQGGQLVSVLEGHTRPITSAAFRMDGRYLITSSDDETARLWNPSSGELVATLVGHVHSVASARFSPDGSLVVTAGADGTARVWETRTGRALAILRSSEKHHGQSCPLYLAALSRDGTRVFAHGYNNARVWQLGSASSFPLDGELRKSAERELVARIRRSFLYRVVGFALQRIWLTDST